MIGFGIEGRRNSGFSVTTLMRLGYCFEIASKKNRIKRLGHDLLYE